MRLAGTNARKISTSFRVTVDEHLRLKKLARKAHLNMADYVRQRLGLPALSHWPIRDKL